MYKLALPTNLDSKLVKISCAKILCLLNLNRTKVIAKVLCQPNYDLDVPLKTLTLETNLALISSDSIAILHDF